MKSAEFRRLWAIAGYVDAQWSGFIKSIIDSRHISVDEKLEILRGLYLDNDDIKDFCVGCHDEDNLTSYIAQGN